MFLTVNICFCLTDRVVHVQVVEVGQQVGADLHLVALRQESHLHVRLRVVDVQVERRLALRLLQRAGQPVDEGGVDLVERDLHRQRLDVLHHLRQLRHARDLELQLVGGHGASRLLVPAGAGLHLAAHEEEVVLEEELAEVLVILAEEGELVGAVVVLEFEAAPRLVVAGHHVLHINHHAGHPDFAVFQLVQVIQIAQLRAAHVADHDAVGVQRVRREIEADHFALLVQRLQLAPLCADRNRGLLNIQHGPAAEEALLGVVLLVLNPLAVADELLDEGGARCVAGVAGEELAAVETRDGVESAGAGDALQTLAVHDREVHPFDEVVDVLVAAVALPLGDDALHGRLADPLDGGQTEADVALTVGRELAPRLVDIGSHDLDAHALALVHVDRQLIHVREVSAQHGRHVLRGVVGLQVGGLESDPRVAGGVRLVEGVGGELLPVGPDLLQHLRVVAVGLPALQELGPQGIQLRLDLLTHRLAERVGLAAGEVGQQTGEQHDLLLIDRHAISVLEELLHLRQVVFDILDSEFSVHEIGDIVHRAGTIEGIHSDEILKALRMQFLQPVFHAGGFELEHIGRVSASVELVCRLVVYGYRLYIDVYAMTLLDDVQTVMYDGQGNEPEEVHLEHADLLYIMAVVLGGLHIFAGILVFG